jgi:thiol-disulfide isomerase/thioredoxin
MKTPLLAAALLAAACVTRDPLPPLTGAVGPVHQVAFTLPLYPTHEPHDIAKDRGSVVLLDVWATWCEPCRDALPVYEQLEKEYGARGLHVYAINVDEDPRQVPKFVAETKLNLPILLDEKAAVAERNLMVTMMPTTFLVDRKGNIRYRHDGFAEEFLTKYQAEIEQLLAEPKE